MNSWPTLKEWMQFGGIVALEMVIVFAVAKLAALRIHSAQWRRALWQMALLAMLLIVIGELSGVRDFARLAEEPKSVAPPQRKVVVTIKDPDMAFPLPPSVVPTTPPPVHSAPVRLSQWQQHVAWPAVVWFFGAILVLYRGLLAQCTGLIFRLSCRRIDDSGLNERLERIRGALRIRRRVLLLESARAVAPFTFGVWKPVIVLPCRFRETFTAEQQEVALAHELAHVAGSDSAWRSMSDFVCALLWWHPLAWQVKRELGQASEFVADEASLLVADGPNRLAECLVACAKEMRPPALTTWLGMDGGDFRSALGKRVTRLLQLQPADGIGCRVPWYLRLIVPLICAGLLWGGMIMVIKPSEPRGGAWHTSILGTVFAAAPEVKPATKPGAATATNVTGRIAESLREGGPKSNAPVVISPARQEIYAKLQQTYLSEWGPIDNLPLSEVIRSLTVEVRRRSPDGKGLNFMLSQNAIPKPSEEVDAGGSPVDAAGLPIATAPRADINAFTVRLGTILRDVSIEQILNVLTAITDPRMQYSVEDFGVIISPKSRPTPVLYTRFFHVDPNTFQQGLQSVLGLAATSLPRGGQLSRTNSFMTGTVPGEIIVPKVRTWFQSLGVDLNEPGKAIFFNDRLGILMVRATQADLDVIEKAMQLLNMSPPQLTIRVKVFEVDKTENGSALDWFIGTLVTNNSVTSPSVTPTGPPPGIGPTVSDAIPADRLASGMRMKAEVPAPTITGILTDEQFRKMVRTLEQRGGSDMLSAPEVTTMSGRQAQIKVVDVRYIVTSMDYSTNVAPAKPSPGSVSASAGETDSVVIPIAEPFELGPVVDIVPHVMGDGMTIQMTVLPTVREFLGYDDPGDFVISVKQRKANEPETLTQPTPLPRFRLRQVATTAMVLDGQTLMLSAGASRQEKKTRDASGKVTTTFKDKELFYFITPRLVDPAGNPLHSQNDLEAAHSRGVPKQASK